MANGFKNLYGNEWDCQNSQHKGGGGIKMDLWIIGIEDSPEIYLHKYGQWMFDPAVRAIQWRKYNIFSNGTGSVGYQMKQKELQFIP